MNRQEALEQLLLGNKITWTHFTSDEYFVIPEQYIEHFTIKNAKYAIVCEQGCPVGDVFLTNEMYNDDGWRVYIEPTKEIKSASDIEGVLLKRPFQKQRFGNKRNIYKLK